MNASNFETKHIDAHTHIQFDVFDKDREETINRARSAGIGLVIAGSGYDDSRRGIDIAKQYESGIYACIGLHPGNTYHSSYNHEVEKFDEAAFGLLAQEKKVVGIGECGLDYFKLEGDEKNIKQTQKDVFLQHIMLAKKHKKPLVIHCREAYDDLHSILLENKNDLACAPLMHFFAGSVADARRFLDLGFYFTFGGVITFPPKKNSISMYDEVIKFIPVDRILSETDAPDVAPVPYRGKRNEPLYVLEVEKRIAELKNVSCETYAAQAVQNAKRLFGI